MYKYYISFFYKDGYGDSFIIRKRKITTIEDIKEIKKELENYKGIHNLSIINYILLSEEEK